MLELGGSESEQVCVWALQEELPVNPGIPVFHSFNPHWFSQPEVVGTYLPGTGTLGGGPGVWDQGPSLLRRPSQC